MYCCMSVCVAEIEMLWFICYVAAYEMLPDAQVDQVS